MTLDIYKFEFDENNKKYIQVLYYQWIILVCIYNIEIMNGNGLG